MLFDYISYNTACVYGIYGHLGGGKTLTAVDIMVDALRSSNNSVFTNIRLKNLPNSYSSRVSYFDDISEVNPWEIPTGSPRGSGGRKRVFVVVDEVAEFFDQYSSTSPVLRNFLSWLRHSSKRGQWVFLIVQNPSFIAKSLRLLVNWWICCDDMDNFRVPVVRLKMPFLSGFVRRIVTDKHGNVVSRGMNLCDKLRVGQYYDTAQSIATLGRNIADKNESTSIYIPFRRIFLLMLFIWVGILMYYSQ